MAASSSFIARLPSELCASIISDNFISDHDLIPAWINLRNVSKFWRGLVEDFVRKRHLPHSYIMLCFDPCWSPGLAPSTGQSGLDELSKTSIADLNVTASWPSAENSHVRYSSAVFRFVRTQPDAPELATFELEDPHDEIYVDMCQSRGLLPATSDSTRFCPVEVKDWSRPPHVLSVRRLCNDTELPGLALRRFAVRQPDALGVNASPEAPEAGSKDREAPSELRIDWKAALNELVLEERLRQFMSGRWLRDLAAKRAALDDQIPKLSHASGNDLHAALRLQLLAQSWDADNSARRARMKRVEALQQRQQDAALVTPKIGDNDSGTRRNGPRMETPDAKRERERAEYAAFERLCEVQQLVNGWTFTDE